MISDHWRNKVMIRGDALLLLGFKRDHNNAVIESEGFYKIYMVKFNILFFTTYKLHIVPIQHNDEL